MVHSQVVGQVSASSFTARRDITKEMLAKKLSSVLNIINRQNEYITHLEKQCQNLKSEVIINQGAVIDLQKELIASKSVQLTDLKTTVADMVESVQQEAKSAQQSLTKSFSDALKSGNVANASTVISKDTLKKVAKEIVVEEELSKNIMVFGLQEGENEELSSKVEQVFQSLGEKPCFEAARLGKKSNSTVRPVKVNLRSSATVQQILKKSSLLCKIEQFKTVFLSPDRTAEQRAQQKELVQELKQKRTEAGNGKKFFIKGGIICCVDK